MDLVAKAHKVSPCSKWQEPKLLLLSRVPQESEREFDRKDVGNEGQAAICSRGHEARSHYPSIV